MAAEMPELALAGAMPEAEGEEDDDLSESMLALEEAMPKAKPAERAAMKRAMEACVAEALSKGGGY